MPVSIGPGHPLYNPPPQSQPGGNTMIPFGPGHPLYDGRRPRTQPTQPTSPGSNPAGPAPGTVPTTPYGDPTPPTGQNPFVPLPGGGGRPTTPGTPTSNRPIINQPPTGGTTGGGAGTQTRPVPTTQQPQQPPASPNINTSITPLLPYTEQMMNTARNQIVATQGQSADPRWLTKRFATPGRSNDAGVASAAMPFLAQSQFLGNQGYAQQSLGDYLANQESLLAGEIAREKEGLGLGNLLARLQEGNIASTNSMLSPLLNQLL
jgi:hypothetical protein